MITMMIFAHLLIGTLTCNVMNFKCLYINGMSYGVMEDGLSTIEVDRQGSQKNYTNPNKTDTKDSPKDDEINSKDVNS